MRGIRIGELLVEQGVLNERQVDQLLIAQRQTHRPLGDLAERLFGIHPSAVEDAWVQQYLRANGSIDLDEETIDRSCLRLLNARQAWQFHILPLRRDDREIRIATSPEDLVRAVNFSTRALDEPVYIVIAPREQLSDHLMKHYPVPQFLANYAAGL